MVLAVGLAVTPAVAASAQDDRSRPTTTLSVIDDDGGGRPEIVPDPFSGEAPDDSGDRGGAAQIGLLGALVVGLGLTAGRVVHVARRADRDRSTAVDR